jgi:Protein of unknown function (DUF1214)
VILYDRQTRSMLQTDQHLPRLGSQSGTVETNPDGTTDLYFGPTAPDGKENNWLQTVPRQGLVDDPAALPAPVVLRQDLATQRDPTDLTRDNHRLPAAGQDRRRWYRRRRIHHHRAGREHMSRAWPGGMTPGLASALPAVHLTCRCPG